MLLSCHGDGSDGRHVCTKYHVRLLHVCLRLFACHFVVTMATVVMGGMCVQRITAIHTIICVIVINCLRLFVVVIYCYHG